MKSNPHASWFVRRESGVVLLIALIALVAISLAGVALMRSVDTGLLVAGNLAFRQASTQIADAGTEDAIAWLAAASNETLEEDVIAAGYYASRRDVCDIAGKTPATTDDVVWSPLGTAQIGCNMVAAGTASASLVDGYTGTYVINRMCAETGSPNSVECSRLQSDTSGATNSTKTGGSYGQTPLSGTSQIYYRITTRVDGPRNTSAMIQTVVAF